MIIKEGVRPSNNEFVFDMTDDKAEDLINTSISKELNFTKFQDNAYYFGYKFNESISSQDRTRFIEWLKSQSELTPDLEAFIIRPIKALKKEINIKDFDLIIYPLSGRSQLTNFIVKCIGNITGRDITKGSIEAIKSIPENISFDYELFKQDNGIDENSQRFKDVYNYVEHTLIPKIHNLDYFSLAKTTKVKYRDYIENYLNIPEKDQKLINAIEEGKILIIDDISTSGATLKELLRIINNINNKCEIYIFTLIGK